MNFYPVVATLLVVLIFSLGWHLVRRKRRSRNVVIALAFFALVPWMYVCWLFRDGLGQDSVVSSGLQAWGRFIDGFWIPFFIFVVVVIFSCFVTKKEKFDSLK
ncbi:hypothetical protein [Xanthomonas sacchari]|uniref:hypothetical protein n=1 Tax=Xanthomonas sacchari TaxID=56458 RepID=UPI00225903D4|nr:hypothetical protein [Xanthomonas sacchari]